jgi:hypothetical protein
LTALPFNFMHDAVEILQFRIKFREERCLTDMNLFEIINLLFVWQEQIVYILATKSTTKI